MTRTFCLDFFTDATLALEAIKKPHMRPIPNYDVAIFKLYIVEKSQKPQW